MGVGGGEGFAVAVDEGKTHAMLVAEFGDGKADTGGGTCYEGCVAGFENGVEGHGWVVVGQSCGGC